VKCVVEVCDRQAVTRTGLCRSHYEWQRNNPGVQPTHKIGQTAGRPEDLGKTLERFMAKVEVGRSPDDCWLWVGWVEPTGYGVFQLAYKRLRAHRWSYEHFVGPIPEGLVLDHLCRVTNCVNPAHLEPVTNRENVLRGESPLARNARKTHCKRGHEFTSENTIPVIVGGNPGRACRACRRDRVRTDERARRLAG
jgi:hypothetical protein